MIKSVYDNQDDILRAIQTLHCPEGYQCDLTYGNGTFWKNIERPKYCFDITPLHEGVVAASSEEVPLEDASLKNVVFDPPFITYVKNGRAHSNGKAIMSARFGGYYTYDELMSNYNNTLRESYRILEKKGKMIFKCQDIIHNHRIHCTHVNVINNAAEVGFRLLDLFVLSAKHRMPVGTNRTQQHARIYHCYFLVFIK